MPRRIILLHELKGSQEDAILLVNKIASENGYNLTDHTHLINAGVNKLYVDESRKSPYPELEDENLKVGFYIYKDKIYASGQFCGVKEGGDLSSTTVSISVSLPAFKR